MVNAASKLIKFSHRKRVLDAAKMTRRTFYLSCCLIKFRRQRLILIYDFSEKDFIKRCSENMRRNQTTIYQDIIQSLISFLIHPVDPNKHIIDIRHSYHDDYEYGGHDLKLSMPYYMDTGRLDLWHVAIDLYSENQIPLDIENVLLPSFMKMISLNYGGNIKKSIKVKQHNLKTKNKVTVEIKHIQLDKRMLKKLSTAVNDAHTDLIPDHYGVWEWRQTFYNKITGNAYFCQCFKRALEKSDIGKMKQALITLGKQKKQDRNIRHPEPHPHLYYAVTKNAFKEGICHLCSGQNSDLFYCHPMYCSSFKVRYGAYIEKISIEQGINERDAENVVREMKGIPKIGERWINETMLFNYIDIMFPEHVVKREASPDWLDQQRLDIYIPAINLAVEYQGQQHYKAVELFGGKEGLKKTKERDILKARKCKQQKVDLIYFTYKDNLSEKLVGHRLKKYLK